MSKKADTEIEVTEKKVRTCFIITPIGEDKSTTRRHIDGVNKSVIEPILNEFGYKMNVSHESYNSGSIKSEIIKSIYESDLVIANLTFQNPNVLYEVAIRHCAGKPIIHIAEDVKLLPFDINDHRTFEYSNDMQGTIELAEKIKIAISEIEKKPDGENNPVLNSLKITKVIDIPENTVSFDKLLPEILSSIKSLSEKVDFLQREKSSSKYRSGKITIDPANYSDINGKITVPNLSFIDQDINKARYVIENNLPERYTVGEEQLDGRINRDTKDNDEK